MRITADTNILVRVIVLDDLAQARTALDILTRAETVFLPLPCLCEFAWVLERTYGLSRQDIAASLRQIIQRGNVETDAQAVDAGLRVLDGGGDFADGVIASVGAQSGADKFVSFDRKAVARVKAIGMSAELVTIKT
ncbi:type II toxin-antitoxin system VapC family toxin [Mesorhizobium australicum]|uniref:Predicted nucleic-acid-binding protein, contains PIN domain n=1 Tax=Mesorhizobium australicum TaxID=536018 RepID=A0A1X7NPC1_9HYPH|nr:type II toxin-antitoxin system VapC family toxin [Mesorhizobium australicum]SMH39849.1 Predicted nucleic-acid-binding protein, contains PIN domain [Mesorhizobium australicum]